MTYRPGSIVGALLLVGLGVLLLYANLRELNLWPVVSRWWPLLVDLTGDWKRGMDADIQGGVGSATIRLPGNAGVRVHATGGIGSINAGGLRREGDAYVNEAYGKSPVTLRLNIEGGVGTINLVPGW